MESRIGYVLAAILLVSGIAAAGWVVQSEIAALKNVLTRIVVPGASELTLDAPGAYTIFHEAESVVGGRLYSAQNIAGLRVTVTGEADGKAAPVIVPNVRSTYSIGSHSGVSVLAIGREFIWGLFRAIFGAVGAVSIGIALALALALTTYFRRRRLRLAQA